MLFFVIGFNLGIALLNCYLVWRLWQLRRFLIRVTRVLTFVEGWLDKRLLSAPGTLMTLGDNTSALKHNYERLERQWQSLQPILLLISLSRRYRRKPRKL